MTGIMQVKTISSNYNMNDLELFEQIVSSKETMNAVNQLQSVSLSNRNIIQMMDGRVKIVMYSELHKYKSIDQLLQPYNKVVLLFEWKEKYGHWAALFKPNDHTVSFFNSYDGYPDDALLNISKQFRKEHYEDYPYLSQLLLNSPYELTYNDNIYQSKKANISTCGRWCTVRLILSYLDDDEFHNFIKTTTKKYKITGDQLVTILTSF
jgi:hypothetical protein